LYKRRLILEQIYGERLLEEEKMSEHKRTFFLCMVLLFIGGFLGANQETNTELVNISFKKTDQQMEVTVETKGDVSYESFSLLNPNRLVIDFFGIEQVSSPALLDVNQMNITSIRSALNRPGVGRVVFNFTEDFPSYEIKDSENAIVILFWTEALERREIKTEQVEKPPQKVEEVFEPVKKKEERVPEEIDKAEPKKKVVPREQKRAEVKNHRKKMAFGVSAGYLALQDDAFRDAYGEGGIFFRGEYSFLLPISVESIDVWTGMSYFQKGGTFPITEEELKLRITTFSFALRYLKKMSRFSPFLGAGIDYIVYKETYPEDFIIESVGGSTLGFHGQAGTYIDVIPNLSFKIHIKYNFAKTTENELEVNLGGPEYGASIVFRFDL
jgi:outer membrane protein W